MSKVDKFQCVKNNIPDKESLLLEADFQIGTPFLVSDLPFTLLAEKQIALVVCSNDDQALINAAPDGLILELDVTTYLLVDPLLGAVAGNIAFEQQSRIAAYKLGGTVYLNNASTGAFNGNALLINAVGNPLALTSLALSTF